MTETKALEWIDAVLTHKTTDHMLNHTMVSAMANIVTATTRTELAIVLRAFVNSTGSKEV